MPPPGIFIFLWLVLGLVDAQYFRYGHIEWERLNPDDYSRFIVQFSFKLGVSDHAGIWSLGMVYPFEGNMFKFGDGTRVDLNSTIVQYNRKLKRFYVNPVRVHEYSGPGPWTAMIESGPYARDETLLNNDLKKFRLKCIVNLNDYNYHSPSITEPVSPNFWWNQTDFRLQQFDADGDAVTFRLSTPYEYGDALVPKPSGEDSQISIPPYQLTVDPDTGLISWTKAKDLQEGEYQLQIMFQDGKGAEVPLDFILINKKEYNERPTIKAKFRFNPDPSAPETFLIDQPILFNLTACDATDVMDYIDPIDTYNVMQPVGPLVINGLCGLQVFNFTPREDGYSRHCFYAYDTYGSASKVFCFAFIISPRPQVYTVWQSPTKQVTGWAIEAWFTGLFLSAGDRVNLIPDGASCEDLAPDSGWQVTYVYNQVNRIAVSPNLNYQNARADVIAGAPGLTRWCYKLRAATGYTFPELNWQQVAINPYSFEVTSAGPYRVSTLVSCPLYDKAFRYVIEGKDLLRFDRVQFITPSLPPPAISTSNCEDLSDTDGTMINNFPVVDGLQPGFVAGGERVEFPWKHSVTDVINGQYLCYKPYKKPWLLLNYTRPLQRTGVFGLLSSDSLSEDAVNITLQGINLTESDRWAVYPYRVGDDCSSMSLADGNTSSVFLPATDLTNTPSFIVNGTTYPGINMVSLCYLHEGRQCKIDIVDITDPDYGRRGIPDPKTTTPQYPWVDYNPVTAFVNEPRIYEFTGYAPFGYILNEPCMKTADCAECKGFEVKVAAHSSCAGTARGGEERVLDRNRRVIFRLEEVGNFRFCIRHRMDWEEVARPLMIVDNSELSNSTAFYGYGYCRAYLQEQTQGACGCFLSGYNGQAVDIPVDHPVSTAVSTSLNFNQGCCSSPSSRRVQVGFDTKNGVKRSWGHCEPPVVVIPVPPSPEAGQGDMPTEMEIPMP